MPRIFLSAGDYSGVAIAVTLMRTLRRRLGDIDFAGMGGPEMVAEGMRSIYDPARTSAMWLWANIQRVPAHRRAMRACIEDWERERPDLVITIDYQAFHLFVGTRARARGIPVLHFVGSQFWGRRYYTIEPTRRAYSHVLLIHEFEKPFYDEAGIPATFVGPPLFERLACRELDTELIERLQRIPRPRIAILPGSRRSEIRANLPVLLDAAVRLSPRPRLLVSSARPESNGYVEAQVRRAGLDAEVLHRAPGEILSAADAALITSGSASMEAVYYGCPTVVVYRLSRLSYFFAKPHIAGSIALPNLTAGKEIVPELVLASGRGEPVARAAQELLDSEERQETQRREFTAIRERLQRGRPTSEIAADVVEQMLRSGVA